MIIWKKNFEELTDGLFNIELFKQYLDRKKIYYETYKIDYRDEFDYYCARIPENYVAICQEEYKTGRTINNVWCIDEKIIYHLIYIKINLEYLIKLTKRLNNLKCFL